MWRRRFNRGIIKGGFHGFMTFQSVLCEAAHSFLLVDLWERKEHIEVRQPEARALQEGGKVTHIKAKKKTTHLETL